ncbi:MAG: hypothetical protein DRH04_04115, partial [Deltaproteobacteria bacterium]
MAGGRKRGGEPERREKARGKEGGAGIRRKKVATSLGPSPGEGEVLEVRVWREVGKGRAPAPGAGVFLEHGFLETYKEDIFLLDQGRKGGGPATSRRREIEEFRADEEGKVSLRLKEDPGFFPPGEEEFRLWAESKEGKESSGDTILKLGQGGEVWIRKPSGNDLLVEKGVDLFLSREPGLEYVVKDGYGRPVPDVPVGLYSAPAGIGKHYSLCFRGRSGKDGRGRFPRIMQWLRQTFGNGKIHFRNFYLGFAFPLKNPTKRFVRLSEENFKGTPVR